MAGGGGSEPNLTPFIDLFSVLICFLLMTAAWLSLEAFPVQIEKAAEGATNTQAVPDDKPKEKKVALSVKLGPTDLRAKEDEAEKIIPHQVDGSIDRMALENVMRTWKQKYPDRKDVVLNTEGNVNYGRMIALYDMLIQMEWSDVGINPN